MGRQKRQTEIEGTERYHDPEISAAVENYKEALKKRAALKVEADAAREHLIELMLAKDITEYVDEELRAKVTVTRKERLSFTKIKVDDEGIDDEDDDTAEAAE